MTQSNSSTNKLIYFDHSATTPVDPVVFEAMKPYFCQNFGNPGSLHNIGVEARRAVLEARGTIAEFLGCNSTEIVFTSGGSESDNLAIRGVVSSVGSRQSAGTSNTPTNDRRQTTHDIPHVITSAIEHKAVLDTVKKLEKEGKIEATYIKPKPSGVIDVADVEKAIKENTILVSIMYVNNEIGTIQPIGQIGRMLKEVNKRLATNNKRIYFHTDAVQATEYCPMNVNSLGVDLLTLTAHKIYGPKGIGLLYLRQDTPIQPEITGGGQERGFRAGTENVAGIVGLAAAISMIKDRKSEEKQENSNISLLRDRLIDGLLTTIPNSYLNGDPAQLAPHIANISFVNAEGESILLNLDLLGICVSTGSACTSRLLEPSHVLTALGVPPEKAHGSIRFSLGKNSTKAEIDHVIQVMPAVIEKFRMMSPFK